MAELGSFGRHTPRILRRQLILQLIEQYIGENRKSGSTPKTKSFMTDCRPSIQRFHGALLFVDISGFTALSLRLSVEELKNHINDYFTSMLDIVDRFGGDVIKFAGDALFIIWETEINKNSATRNGSLDSVLNDTAEDAAELTDRGDMSPSGSSPSGSDKNDFTSACRLAVNRAVECGREISSVCGNHKVQLTVQKPTTDKSPTAASPNGMFRLLPSIGSMFGANHSNGPSPRTSNVVLSAHPENGGPAAEDSDSVAYLNVHSGVSVGLMAGIDIGANDRWEYFLVGDPLTKVAVAEGQASTGDVVICAESHALLHPTPKIKEEQPVVANGQKVQRRLSAISLGLVTKIDPNAPITPSPSHAGGMNTTNLQSGSNAPPKPLSMIAPTPVSLPCGCIKMKDGFCKVQSKENDRNANRRKSRVKTRMENSVQLDDKLIKDSKLVDSIEDDIETAYHMFQPVFQRELAQCVSDFAARASQDGDGKGREGVAFTLSDKSTAKLAEDNKLHFMKWIHACLLDDMARHVHAVAREDYIIKDVSRTNPFRAEIEHNLVWTERGLGIKKQEKVGFHRPSGHSMTETQSDHGALKEPASPRQLLNSKSATVISSGKLVPLAARQTQRRAHTGEADSTSALIAEIRAVTVMFVKIDIPNTELVVDTGEKGTPQLKTARCSTFLLKTVNEKLADELLLNRLQDCIGALSNAFANYGGQLRQFIVDDKGTVCIGTFGLRGSVSDDNAAAALETAKLIVDKLQNIGLNCSIGVTVGRAFCGLVGSSKRHEYAVMGPSTNLSARLMCKAPPGGIICDVETRNRDRTHGFETLSNIIAKGYKDPVGIFKPLFQDDRTDGSKTQGDSRLMTRASYDFSLNDSNIKAALRNAHNVLEKQGSNSMMSVSASSFKNTFQTDSKLIRQMLKRNFYLTSNTMNATNPQKKYKLHGRRKEIESILLFIFTTLVEPGSFSISKNSSSNVIVGGDDSKSIPVKAATFNVKRPARFVGLVGSEGMGKSATVNAITQQIFSVVASDPSHNIHLFKSRYNSFQVSLPFNAWKPIITEMLMRIHRIVSVKASPSAAKVRRRSLVTTGVNTGASDAVAGADFALKYLPEHMRALKPLLGDLSIIPEDRAAIDALKLSNLDKLNKSSELLLALIQCYTHITNNLVFITVEDIDTFDLASLSLLRQVWENNSGIVVIFTLKQLSGVMDGVSGTATPVFRSPEQRRSSVVSSRPAGTQDIDFTDAFDDPDRYLEVELFALDKNASSALVKDVLTSFGVPVTDTSMLENFYDMSGGNPMYTFELAKSIAEEKNSSVTNNSNNNNSNSNTAARSHRIEEVICHRFDQLNTGAQTVLKMAAVASCNGVAFTSELICFVLDDETSDMALSASIKVGSGGSSKKNVSVNVVNALHDILQSDDFIRVTKKPSLASTSLEDVTSSNNSPVSDRLPAKITKEMIASNKYCFEFKISLEQRTIYDLLLDDQKQVIHECVAEYYESQRTNHKLRSISMDTSMHADNFFEESFHWQHAANWSCAMTCSYQAVCMESNEQKRNMHISNAYALYQTICRTTDTGDHSKLAHGELRMTDVNALFLSAFIQTSSSQKSQADDTLSSSANILTMERIFQIFNGDPELLEVGLHIMVKTAQKCLKQFEHPEHTQQLLEDALQIVLHTKNPHLLSSRHLSNMIKAMNRQSIVQNYEQLSDDDYFCIRSASFSSICLPVLAAYVQNYLYFSSCTPESHQKALYIAKKFLELSEDPETSSAAHKVQALNLMTHTLIKTGKAQESLLLFGELLTTYSFEEHSQQLISHYESDRMPLTLALVSQQMYLTGQCEAATKHIDLALALLLKTNHATTLSLAVVRVVATLVFVHRHAEALKLFTHYLAVKTDSGVEHEQIVEDIDTVYLEWLQRCIKFQAFVSSGDTMLFSDDSADLDRILIDQATAFQTHQDAGDRPLIHDYLCIQGRGLESVFAELCAMKIAVLCKQSLNDGLPHPSLGLYCESALTYAKHTLAMKCDHPHKLMFNAVSALTVVAQIAQSLSTLSAEPARDYLSTFKTEFHVRNVQVAQMKHLAKEHKHHFVSLLLSFFHKHLHKEIEDEAGLAETLQQLHLHSHGAGFAVTQELLKRVMPADTKPAHRSVV